MTRLWPARPVSSNGDFIVKSKSINTTDMSMKELADIGAPYLVAPEDLEALGVDPDPYLRSGGGGAGWMLDRKNDAALIERLQSMAEPHGTVQ
jgi:hypothetical protein